MKTTRPLRQTLAEAAEPGQAVTLTCHACFQILEALVEAAAVGADPHGLRRAAWRHLTHSAGTIAYSTCVSWKPS